MFPLTFEPAFQHHVERPDVRGNPLFHVELQRPVHHLHVVAGQRCDDVMALLVDEPGAFDLVHLVALVARLLVHAAVQVDEEADRVSDRRQPVDDL